MPYAHKYANAVNEKAHILETKEIIDSCWADRVVQIESVVAARPDTARRSKVLQADGSTLRLKVESSKTRNV